MSVEIEKGENNKAIDELRVRVDILENMFRGQLGAEGIMKRLHLVEQISQTNNQSISNLISGLKLGAWCIPILITVNSGIVAMVVMVVEK